MASTSEPTAPFPTRSTITSLWSARRSRLAPSLTSHGTASNTESRSGSRTNGGRHQEAPRKARDEEAETWGSEASMGIGAGKPVKSDADKDSELRGRMLGKRRREVDEKGNWNEKGKAVAVASDSEEEVGRSALGRRKKRRVDPVRPSGPAKEAACVAEARDGTGAAEVNQEDGAAAVVPAEAGEAKGGEEEGKGAKSPPAENPPVESTKPKRKKKKNKKRKAE